MLNKTSLKSLPRIFVFLLILTCSVSSGRVIYVDADASGANNGSSWADAYHHLQTALIVAVSGDEVRVAEGIYKPDHGVGRPGDRTTSFQLKNGVTITGGYAGFGQPDPNARDISTYETILSGDLNGNDGTIGYNSENSYHVITAGEIDTTAVLDGFTITAGNANDEPWSSPHAWGGGIYLSTSSPVIMNCKIRGNYAIDGGGICCDAQSSPEITNCAIVNNSGRLGGGMSCWWSSNPTLAESTFSENRAEQKGGGMYNYDSNPTVVNCTFSTNSSQGGGIYNDENSCPTLINCTFTGNSASGMYNDSSSPTLINCIFSSNLVAGYGGGMRNSSSSPTLINCTFSGNLSRLTPRGTVSIGGDGGGMYNYESNPTLINCTLSANFAVLRAGGIFNDANSSPGLTNCILWGNTDSGRLVEPAQIQGGTPVINYCCVHGWSGRLGGTGNIQDDPLFRDSDGPDDIVGTQDDDLSLSAGSPCIDAGDNNAVPFGVVTDLSGNPRFFDDPVTADTGNGAPPIVDMGAYEFQSVCGDPDHPYPPGDLNQDCRVNFLDIAVIAVNWLACTAPQCD